MPKKQNKDFLCDELKTFLLNIAKISEGGYKLMAVQQQLVKSDVISQLFNISVRRVQQLTQDGVLKTVKDPKGGARKYDLIPTIQTYIQYLSDKAYGKASTELEADLKKKKLEAEIALKESQAELHVLKTSIAAGEYISVEEVKLDFQRFFAIFKKFALAIPNRVTGHLLGYVEPVVSRSIEKDIDLEVKSMLKTFIVAGHEPPSGDKK